MSSRAVGWTCLLVGAVGWFVVPYVFPDTEGWTWILGVFAALAWAVHPRRST